MCLSISNSMLSLLFFALVELNGLHGRESTNLQESSCQEEEGRGRKCRSIIILKGMVIVSFSSVNDFRKGLISTQSWGHCACACNLACVFCVQNILTSLPTWNLTHCRSVIICIVSLICYYWICVQCTGTVIRIFKLILSSLLKKYV